MPPLPTSIALHIGAHKTASSHLQNVFYHNRALLEKSGIRFFGPRYLRLQGRSLAAMLDLSWSQSPPPQRKRDAQLEFLAKGGDRLVFSEENFVGSLADPNGRLPLPLYPQAEARITELAEKLAPLKMQLYVAVRNPASYMASAYSQALYGGSRVGPRTFRARNDWRQVDWADYVERLRAIPGLGEMFVWRHEDYNHAHRLILRRLSRWGVGPRLETLHERLHQGMSADAVRQTLSWAQDGREGDLAREARDAFPVSDEHPAFRLYAPSTLAQADHIYGDQIARIEALKGVTILHPPNPDAPAQLKG